MLMRYIPKGMSRLAAGGFAEAKEAKAHTAEDQARTAVGADQGAKRYNSKPAILVPHSGQHESFM